MRNPEQALSFMLCFLTGATMALSAFITIKYSIPTSVKDKVRASCCRCFCCCCRACKAGSAGERGIAGEPGDPDVVRNVVTQGTIERAVPCGADAADHRGIQLQMAAGHGDSTAVDVGGPASRTRFLAPGEAATPEPQQC